MGSLCSIWGPLTPQQLLPLGGSLLSQLLAQAPSTGSTEIIHTQKLFLARTENENSIFFPYSPPNPQSFSSAEANGAKKGTGQHIKHYPFNPSPVPHLPMSASCPSFPWLLSLLLSACCLWFAPSGCYCFDLLNFCNPDPNP